MAAPILSSKKLKSTFASFFILSVLLTVLTSRAEADEFKKVIRVVDGDTAVIDSIGRVRLIGVNTPESVDPRRPVEYFGKEAARFLRETLEGKKVRLEFDQERKDRYGRTLAYLFLEDGTFVNALIIERGYGFAYTRFPFKHMDQFRKLEREAREAKRGLWADHAETDKATENSEPKLEDGTFSCQPAKRCKHMRSCAEAKFHLKQCGAKNIDGDGDGIPCEALCRGE